MPKLPSKTNSFDLLAQQQPSPHSRGVESPYQHSNINFSSIARNGTPPGLAANSSPVAGGIRPLNSPIGTFTYLIQFASFCILFCLSMRKFNSSIYIINHASFIFLFDSFFDCSRGETKEYFHIT
jgi:hypothetical protein